MRRIRHKTGKSSMVKASFTVEAAMIMTVLLPVLAAVIYMVFYVHDAAVIQGAACETAAMGGNLLLEENRESVLQEKGNALVTERLLGTKAGSAVLSVGKDQISVHYKGSFKIPGLIAGLVTGNELSVEKTWNKKIFHPAEEIRKIRGLEYMINTIRE
ncbi:MAG: pilus assembly protein [Lachnospiraceae bacterium]|nr:pilus assembly protein [Lachnospiraceae bacterium]